VDGGINRVIIASDGDMNVGTVDIEALKNLVERKRETGISLTTLGFGSGNYNYALMEQLADVGNGNAAYIDGIREAQKVLVNEMQSTLLTIAKDVKIQVEFNPAVISEYRLIGYENRILNREDFRNDKVDAGEIGAGHTVTALYEVVLKNSDANMITGLRYGNSEKTVVNSIHSEKEMAFVRLRYKKPGQSKSTEFAQAILLDTIKPDIEQATHNLKFAAAVAGFGQLLRGGKFIDDWNYDHVIQLATSGRGKDRNGYRSEFVSMAQLAKSYTSSRG
jgi:Ca-activated chloride channel family protein